LNLEMSPPAKRVRRTPEEARRVILDAAEIVLARTGPAGLRLQEVAEAAGVSHPTILHHFESREGLIRALNQRTLADLRGRLMAVMDSADGTSAHAVAAAFAAYRDGLAQRIVFMLQAAGAEDRPTPGLYDDMVDALQAVRQRHAPAGATVDRFDSEAIVHLTTLAGFADALIGPRLRRGATPQAEAAARARFERWLGDLLDAHIMGGGGLNKE
jgi:AcrR family transcriptional regulator